MLIEFEEILHDLELKRAAALEPGERPPIDVAAALGTAVAGSGTELRIRDEDGSERPFEPVLAAALVAGALSTLAAASGESDADTAAGRQIIRAATSAVITRLAELDATVITDADLSALVEAALIDAGQYDVAKALVVARALPRASTAAPAGTLRLIRRGGEVVPWNTTKIETAIRKAFLSLQLDPSPAGPLAGRVAERARSVGSMYVSIETIQDLVQEELVLGGHMRVAERYIVYRAERALLRAEQRSLAPARDTLPPIPVVGADGDEGLWDGADLRARITFAQVGLELPMDAEAIERELRRSIRPGVLRSDLERVIVMNAKSLVERDSDFALFAGRIMLTYIYEETLDWDVLRDGIGALQRGPPARTAAGDRARRLDRPDGRGATRLRRRSAGVAARSER